MQNEFEKNLEEWHNRGKEAEALYQRGLLQIEKEPLEGIKSFYEAFRHNGHLRASLVLDIPSSGFGTVIRLFSDEDLKYRYNEPLTLEGTCEDIFYRGLQAYSGIGKEHSCPSIAKECFEYLINNNPEDNPWVREAHFMMGIWYEQRGDKRLDYLLDDHYLKAAERKHSNAQVKVAFRHESRWLNALNFQLLRGRGRSLPPHFHEVVVSAYQEAVKQYDLNASLLLGCFLVGPSQKVLENHRVAEVLRDGKNYLKQALEGGCAITYPYLSLIDENPMEGRKWVRRAMLINPAAGDLIKKAYDANWVPLSENEIENYAEDSRILGPKVVHDFLVRNKRKDLAARVVEKCSNNFYEEPNKIGPPGITQVTQSANNLDVHPVLRWKQKMLSQPANESRVTSGKTPLDKMGNNRHILLSVEEDAPKNAKQKQKVRKVVKKTQRPEEKEIDNNRQSQRQRRL